MADTTGLASSTGMDTMTNSGVDTTTATTGAAAALSPPMAGTATTATAETKPNVATTTVTTTATVSSSSSSPSTSKMTLIGSQRNGMYLIHPDPDESDEDREVLEMIKTIKARLQEKAYIDKCRKWILNSSIDRSEKEAESAREIQGKRIEMFLKASNKLSTAFDEVLGPKLPPNAKERILAYAQRQALKDPRMKENDDGKGWEFDNFSLIITYGKVDMQAPHLDLIRPLFQFGLMVSDKSPSTLLYDPEDPDNADEKAPAGEEGAQGNIGAIEELKQHWTEMLREDTSSSSDNDGIPEIILKVLDDEDKKNDSLVKQLLVDYGLVLRSWKFASFYKNRMKQIDKVRTGSLMSMPGGVVHAGAKSQKMRCVIFFSAKPKSSSADVQQYDPDVQWMTTTLAFRLITLLWYKTNIDFNERKFFLRRLVQYVENCTVKGTSSLCPTSQLSEFLAAIEKKSYKSTMTIDKFIEETAKDEIVTPEIDLSDYQCFKSDSLYTMYDNKEEKVMIFHRKPDDKVILAYPQKHEDGDGYEGHFQNDNYRVQMKEGHEEEIYDGTNAEYFVDNDGDKFDVYLKGEENSTQNTPPSSDMKRSHDGESQITELEKTSKQARLDSGEHSKNTAVLAD